MESSRVKNKPLFENSATETPGSSDEIELQEKIILLHNGSMITLSFFPENISNYQQFYLSKSAASSINKASANTAEIDDISIKNQIEIIVRFLLERGVTLQEIQLIHKKSHKPNSNISHAILSVLFQTRKTLPSDIAHTLLLLITDIMKSSDEEILTLFLFPWRQFKPIIAESFFKSLTHFFRTPSTTSAAAVTTPIDRESFAKDSFFRSCIISLTTQKTLSKNARKSVNLTLILKLAIFYLPKEDFEGFYTCLLTNLKTVVDDNKKRFEKIIINLIEYYLSNGKAVQHILNSQPIITSSGNPASDNVTQNILFLALQLSDILVLNRSVSVVLCRNDMKLFHYSEIVTVDTRYLEIILLEQLITLAGITGNHKFIYHVAPLIGGKLMAKFTSSGVKFISKNYPYPGITEIVYPPFYYVINGSEFAVNYQLIINLLKCGCHFNPKIPGKSLRSVLGKTNTGKDLLRQLDSIEIAHEFYLLLSKYSITLKNKLKDRSVTHTQLEACFLFIQKLCDDRIKIEGELRDFLKTPLKMAKLFICLILIEKFYKEWNTCNLDTSKIFMLGFIQTYVTSIYSEILKLNRHWSPSRIGANLAKLQKKETQLNTIKEHTIAPTNATCASPLPKKTASAQILAHAEHIAWCYQLQCLLRKEIEQLMLAINQKILEKTSTETLLSQLDYFEKDYQGISVAPATHPNMSSSLTLLQHSYSSSPYGNQEYRKKQTRAELYILLFLLKELLSFLTLTLSSSNPEKMPFLQTQLNDDFKKILKSNVDLYTKIIKFFKEEQLLLQQSASATLSIRQEM